MSDPTTTVEQQMANHGTRGVFVRQLYRFRLLGWVLFAITFFYLGIAHLVAISRPKPVQIFNDRGEYIGQITFRETGIPSDEQLVATGAHFLDCRLSANSANIFSDYRQCLQMMSPAFRQRETAPARETEVNASLVAIDKAKTHSWLEFSPGKDAPTVSARKDNEFFVRYRGTLVVAGVKRLEQAFDITVKLVPAARSLKNIYGLEVDDVINN